MILNPEPIGKHPRGYDLYDDEPHCFIQPSVVRVEVEALHVECSCSEVVEGRPDTIVGRCALLDFAAKHAASCGFPESELRLRLGATP